MKRLLYKLDLNHNKQDVCLLKPVAKRKERKMGMTEIVSYLIIGLAAGILSGFFGIGGGLIVIPALIFWSGFSQLSAQGTSLAILLPPTGLLAFMNYYKAGNVNVKAAVIICIMVFLGALFGARFAHNVSPDILRKGFAILLLLSSVKLLFGK